MPARTRRLAAAALLVAAAPLLASCGMDFSTTEDQTPSGNGAFGQAGEISISNLTLVLGDDARSASLIGNLTNVGAEPDALTGVSIEVPKADGALDPQVVPVLPRAFDPVSLGFNSDVSASFYGVDLPASHFVKVRLTFRRAPATAFNVLTVPAVGVYEGLGPKPLASTLPAPAPSA